MKGPKTNRAKTRFPIGPKTYGPTWENPNLITDLREAASHIGIFDARTRVAILDDEGTHVARASHHHRFSSSPEIQTSDLPTKPELQSSANLHRKHLWASNTGENRSPWRDHRSPQTPKENIACNITLFTGKLHFPPTRTQTTEPRLKRRNKMKLKKTKP